MPKRTLVWHRTFEKILGHKHSHYHTAEHVSSACSANQRLLTNALTHGFDPLNILPDLKRYNRQQKDPGLKLNVQEFKNASHLAFLFHDTGNIMSKINSKGQPVFFSRYTAIDAEKRSTLIVKKFLDQTEPNKKIRRRLKKIIGLLITETTFLNPHLEQNRLFARYVRVVDQIGSPLLRPNSGTTGLLHEIIEENPDATINLDFTYNFILRQFPNLIPDAIIQDKILQIFGKKRPPFIPLLLKKPTPIKAVLFVKN